MRKMTKLKKTIIWQGLYQKEVAKRAGLDPAILSLIANGRLIPTEMQRAKIATALHTSVEEIFEKEGVDILTDK